MNYFFPFFIGLLVTFISTILPGLINMHVAKISLKEGKLRAFVLGLGASFIVFFQAFVALVFAHFIDKRIDINQLIQQTGIGIFVLLSVYFFFFAKTKRIQSEKVLISSKRNHFFTGILLSIINVFPIPFYIALSVTLGSYNYFSFEKPFLILFSFGSAFGSLSVFYIYANFIKKVNKTDFFIKNINYIIGIITFSIAIFGVIRLIIL